MSDSDEIFSIPELLLRCTGTDVNGAFSICVQAINGGKPILNLQRLPSFTSASSSDSTSLPFLPSEFSVVLRGKNSDGEPCIVRIEGDSTVVSSTVSVTEGETGGGVAENSSVRSVVDGNNETGADQGSVPSLFVQVEPDGHESDQGSVDLLTVEEIQGSDDSDGSEYSEDLDPEPSPVRVPLESPDSTYSAKDNFSQEFLDESQLL